MRRPPGESEHHDGRFSTGHEVCPLPGRLRRRRRLPTSHVPSGPPGGKEEGPPPGKGRSKNPTRGPWEERRRQKKRIKKGPTRDPAPNGKKEEPGRRHPVTTGSEYGGKERWAYEAAAFEGVPASERREHSNTQGCHRCGWPANRAVQFYASTTINGTKLPNAP